MSHQNNDIVLVKKAQLGDKDSLSDLAKTARVRLHEYVLRLTLNEDLTQDIVQETMLEMLRILRKLRKAETFWPWLYGIATNKTRNHYGKLWRRQTRNFSETGYEPRPVADDDTLSEVVTEELKQIVAQSVSQLAPHHRAILTMRCYDHLSYAEIAKLMGCSEIGARASFYRAKKFLARRLSAYGLRKGSLLLALVAFGKMTATSKVSAAQVAVTGATLQVGPVAALVGATTGKTGLIALAAAGSLAVASVAVEPARVRAILGARPHQGHALPASPLHLDATAKQEYWYYFPEGDQGAVMQRLVQADADGRNPVCQILQNQYANYHFDDQSDTIHINNYRVWKPDLSVTRLPTDSRQLSDFLERIEGHPTDMELTSRHRNGLLVICNNQGERGSNIWRIDRHLNVLEEEYFQVGWPESIPVVDHRDAMHQRGWTYFEITGRVGGRSVSGMGRLPFVHASARAEYPWLKIRVDGGETFVDTPTGAVIYDRAGLIAGRGAGGSVFKGLLRPWMGLHCVDTIRRDAAERELPFETTYDHDAARTIITVYANDVTLVYAVDMEADVIETISFRTDSAGESTPQGELRFAYLRDIPDETDAQYTIPASVRVASTRRQQIPGFWLERLITP
ncbi:MAG: sigma-70 family RNA polymerase sigma factor [Phycisphaerales bacterium]|nr:MAG: sigma-70 family RNA polymerase sigma factor [Phycisphaerales bacterium]